jgi:hypothetical protein
VSQGDLDAGEIGDDGSPRAGQDDRERDKTDRR